MFFNADLLYAELVRALLTEGERVTTRNSSVYRLFAPDIFRFASFPLVQLRKTAWKKALREMEWFMSGDHQCPDELKDWWAGQLSEQMTLEDGYPDQLRWSATRGDGRHDQIHGVMGALKHSPFSRRILLTTWNPGDMAAITQTNENPNTPTTCHGTMVQYSVSAGPDGKPKTLNVYHYQRSADVLLGLPHNLVQHWALLTFFAHHAGLEVGTMHYQLGDVHLYDEPSHVRVGLEMHRWLNTLRFYDSFGTHEQGPRLVYTYGGEVDHVGLPAFKAADFTVVWPEGKEPAKPLTTERPRLL